MRRRFTESHLLKTRPKRNNSGAASFAKVVARVVVAVCLALSLFASLVPLRASADAGAMACCVGKAGHCNSGLAAKQRAKPRPEPEPLCGLKPVAGADGEAIAKNTETTYADEVTTETAGDGIIVLATSSEVTNQRTPESQEATEASQPEATPSLHAASLTKPCPADCSAGTTGVVRQPRPREIALLAHGSRGSLPGQVNRQPRSPDIDHATSATLKCSRPRGPPRSS